MNSKDSSTESIYPEAEPFPLTIWPNPLLSRPLSTVVFPLVMETIQQIRRMYATMRIAGGVGIAANQVGLDVRIALCLLPPHGPEDCLVMINPEIVDRCRCSESIYEGCLSIPGCQTLVRRNCNVKVKWQDMNGVWDEQSFGDMDSTTIGGKFGSRIVQHELDHLDGKCLVDRMGPADKLKNRRQLGWLKERYEHRSLQSE